ncbi:MAG: hypothetical protein Q4A74_03990, partial [Cardiobacteriaceae bacterium]|nr:hypothetical protein [Cardiobacteriaceae bacterium]
MLWRLSSEINLLHHAHRNKKATIRRLFSDLPKKPHPQTSHGADSAKRIKNADYIGTRFAAELIVGESLIGVLLAFIIYHRSFRQQRRFQCTACNCSQQLERHCPMARTRGFHHLHLYPSDSSRRTLMQDFQHS